MAQIRIDSRMRSSRDDAEEVYHRSYDKDGNLVESRYVQCETDYYCGGDSRVSPDNGRTWGEWETIFEDKGDEHRDVIPGNEFTEGLQDFKVESEQYYIHVDPCVKVYATTTFPVADGPHVTNGEVKVPVVYTKMWGKGRVFYNSLGHTYKVFDIPEARELMTRGLLWAAK